MSRGTGTGHVRVFGEFTGVAALCGALDAFTRDRRHDLEIYTPFDLPELDAPLGLGRSRIGWVALVGGCVGLVVSYGIQWWANVYSYPLNAGGRPVHAVPAFVPATFEGTVLGAALATFVGLLFWLRLPRLWAPEDQIDGFERASVDRFWLAVGPVTSGRDQEDVERAMQQAGATRVVRLGGV